MGGKTRSQRRAKRQGQVSEMVKRAQADPAHPGKITCAYGVHDHVYDGPILSRNLHRHKCVRCASVYMSSGLDPCGGCRYVEPEPKPPTAKELGWTPIPQIKISFWKISGYESKAYVNEEPDEDGFHRGTNKHTDELVTVRWDEFLNRWQEVDMP